ncbi:MAG: hypothetical protein RBU37_26045 [Myxococcota bacterium]|nr:hypothetical protein [Myxococcota bacterium]
MNSRLFLAILTVLFGICGLPMDSWALPRNFRNVDTFSVGAMPTGEDIDELATLGIRTIVSLHRPHRGTQQRIDALALQHHVFPIRTRLQYAEEVMRIIEREPPGTVFVHCLHGADRAGAMAAYWLSSRRGLDPFVALAQVMSPSDYHLSGLKMLAREYGMSMAPIPDEVLGRYSGARNGGLEGLKIRGGEWYTRLARNYLQVTLGEPLAEPSLRFWSREAESESDGAQDASLFEAFPPPLQRHGNRPSGESCERFALVPRAGLHLQS